MPAHKQYWKKFTFVLEKYWRSTGISILWDCGNPEEGVIFNLEHEINGLARV